MRSTFNRRQTLALGAGVAAVAMFGAAPALAKNDADEAIRKFTGGKVPVQGKVHLAWMEHPSHSLHSLQVIPSELAGTLRRARGILKASSGPDA